MRATYSQRPFHAGQKLARCTGNESVVLCYCCVSDARGQQHAAHRVPRRRASSSALCLFLFFLTSLFFNRRIKDRRRRDQTQRCAVCERSEGGCKQIRKDPPSARRGSRKLARFASCSSPMHHLSLVRSPVILPQQQPQSEPRGSRSRHR